MQFLQAGESRMKRPFRLLLAMVLSLWVVLAVVFALLPEGSAQQAVAAAAVYWAAAAFAGYAFGRAVSLTTGRERLLWALLGTGLLVRFTGHLFWTVFAGSPTSGALLLAPQALYAVSYALLLGGLLCLVSLTTRRIAPVTGLDALSIVLSVGTLLYFFVLEPAPTGPSGWQASPIVFFRPALDSALLFLSLVTLSLVHRPPFVAYLAPGFLGFLVADVVYLGEALGGPLLTGSWFEILIALGVVFLGFAALHAVPATFTPQQRINPWRVLSFWFGPLSPPLHFGFLLVWGALNPPLPAYVYVGVTVVLLYLALRVALVSFVTQKLTREQEELARRLEQNRVLRDLHETVKQDVHGISLTLRSALEAERRGKRGAAREALGRAFRISREAEYRISRPYDELLAFQGETPPSPNDYLRERLEKFEDYFGIKTHEDLREPLDRLSPAEIAAANRFVVEAFWNVAKHSGARNMYLESRQVGNVFILRVRDDGRGFDAKNPPPGMGLRYLSQRAAEVGAWLDVISTPGRGTTVQLRFRKKK